MPDDLPVAVVAGANTASPQLYYVHTDHLGRPARMTAQNTAWVWDVIYSPFGETSYIWSNPATLDMRFPGQWFQLETGLAYNWHRHYDASLGRYVQPDPIGLMALLQDGPSSYFYVAANPVARKDPTGLIILPPDPNGLPPEWVQDPTHRDPNGSRWRSPGGGCLDFHPGRRGAPGHGGQDHWHDCNGPKDSEQREKHRYPGEHCPQPDDPAPVSSRNFFQGHQNNRYLWVPLIPLILLLSPLAP